MNPFINEDYNDVYIITSELDGHHLGMVVTWISIASLRNDELRFILSLSKYNETTQAIILRRNFIIHKIPKSSYKVAYRFGSSHSSERDKFEGEDYDVHKSGIRILSLACSYGYAEILEQMETEDRFIVYCKIREVIDLKNDDSLKQKDLFSLISAEEKQILSNKYSRDSLRDTPA